jgi:hypothetical protein
MGGNVFLYPSYACSKPLLRYISKTVFQDKRKQADGVSRASLPLLGSVVATVRRRISY